MCERSGPVAQLLEQRDHNSRKSFCPRFRSVNARYFGDALFAERSAELRSFAAQFCPTAEQTVKSLPISLARALRVKD
jgi:hypothetical protein